MRTTNGHSNPQIYRVINANKRHRMPVKAKLSPQRVKRPVTTKLKTQTERSITTANDEYDEDDFYSDLEDEVDDTEWHPHQLKQPRQVIKTSPIRPLLQLLSEESSAETRQRPRIQTSPTVNQKGRGQTLEVASDDEEIITKFELEEPKIQDELLDFESSPSTEARNKNVRRFLWTPKSTSRFLDLWEKHLKDIRGKRKNTLVHKQMAMEMSEYGLTHREMKFKMDSLTKKYK
ncbi:hypothetical protein KR093_006330 [Drosophila rubida]|uniref:Myb/SANT-like DNA-binding domain-containing protein n=1 Tax=Drosophila rubida TaxID=30044 RepID=A0AAD4PL33_9MUSC|nr:hypothetical protein KR093_006330 [Drosophila rubida]